MSCAPTDRPRRIDVRPFKSLKRVLPQTLFGRALLILVMPLILLQAISAWIFYDRYWDTISRRLANAVAGDVALLVELTRDAPDPPALLTAFARTTDIRAVLLEGATLPPEPPPAGGGLLERQLRAALAGRVGRPFRIDAGSLEREVLIAVQVPEGVIEIATPRARLFSATTYVFLAWMVGSSLVLFAVAGVFMRNQVRPIRQLAAAADAFGKGREAGPFRIAGAAEVRQAALAFRLMRDRIQRQIAQRTEMLAGVSHDLRTPLTRMRLELALLGDPEAVRDLRREVAEMERMLEGYLAFARGEGGEAAVPCDLSALLAEIVADARRAGGRITLRSDPGILLPLRPNAVKRCFGNLVANAQRYGRQVWVTARLREDGVEVAIDDDGPGIPPGERENVFRPFYRLDRSRNPATGGIGLGLSIARDVAHGHGGEIRLENSPQGGLRVLVRLPL